MAHRPRDLLPETPADGEQPSPGDGRARGRQQRRTRIIRAAAALASRGGVEAVQMRAVAERAGVALGTLYRYFPSKTDLVAAVVAEEIDLLERGVERHPPAAASPAGRAVDVLLRATQGLRREPELAQALLRALILAEAEAKVPLSERMTGLLLRAARGGSGDGQAPSAEETVLADSLTSFWAHEFLEVLQGRRDYEELQRHLEIVAGRLFAESATRTP